MTPEQLAEIKARVDAVPKGPWVIEGDYPQHVTNAQALVIAECFEGPQYPPSIAEFITHARTDVPALLDDRARLTKGIQHALHLIGQGYTVQPRTALAELLRDEGR